MRYDTDDCTTQSPCLGCKRHPLEFPSCFETCERIAAFQNRVRAAVSTTTGQIEAKTSPLLAPALRW
jgi:hypothetical protein